MAQEFVFAHTKRTAHSTDVIILARRDGANNLLIVFFIVDSSNVILQSDSA